MGKLIEAAHRFERYKRVTIKPRITSNPVSDIPLSFENWKPSDPLPWMTTDQSKDFVRRLRDLKFYEKPRAPITEK